VAPAARSFAQVSALVALWGVLGCAGHEGRTLKMRTALDVGEPRAAISAINDELSVSHDTDLPKDIQGDNALLVLDRASIQQSLAQYPNSQRDFQAADKAIDMLDLAHNAGDSIGSYVFSDSAGRYVAPPYEKLLINTLNMLNYLETSDLNGARIEARRMSVLTRYFQDELHETDNAILGLGGYLAGFAYEKSGEIDEALRYYDEALGFGDYPSLRAPLASLLARGSYSSPRLKAFAGGGSGPSSGFAPAKESAEIVFVIGYGRVPHKVPERIPIGLALTLVANDIQPADARAANRLAAQGLVTWINFPTLAKERGGYEIPACMLDGKYVQLEQAADVGKEVRSEWKKVERKIILSAITRLITRMVAGEGVRRATGGGIVGLLASLGTQATLTALDTPDTRSWETLPARIAVARVTVPAGRHAIKLDARGVSRHWEVNLSPGGWAVASLQALR